MARQLAGKVALVTGSTSGIGLGIAKRLANAGASVVLNGFGDASAIAALCADLGAEFETEVSYHGADLLDSAQVLDMCKFASSKSGSVDILVNNAGIQHVCSVKDFPLEAWNRVLQLNLTACFQTVQHVLPSMLDNGYGRIINVASVHGLVASVNKSAYVAAKHGLIGFTKATALEHAGSGITSNAICPGWVLTPLVQAQVDLRAKQMNLSDAEATESLLGEKQPSRQFVKPEELGELAAFLASPAAGQMTGAALTMDGGWTAQ